MKAPLNAGLTAAVVACLVGGPAPAAAQAAHTGGNSKTVYVAHLHPMNTKVTGHATTGDARFSIEGDNLTISIKVKGAAPDIEHWQHFHGFTDSRDATCPTKSADKNGDGIIDLIETEPAAGTTMVPFDSDPAAMDVAHGAYPKASAGGTYDYHQVVSLEALKAAFAKAFDGAQLDLDRRVVFVHGVPSDTKLASSVASLGPIPAQVTLPIACGTIERAKR
ncbi:MAG TPA: hypothetical protein VFW66_06950 [Gemmatimonadales bacterium]|nr:hypothetical protein [Gemmatimonadales bacterium]